MRQAREQTSAGYTDEQLFPQWVTRALSLQGLFKGGVPLKVRAGLSIP